MMWSIIILLSFTASHVRSETIEQQKILREHCFSKCCYRWSGITNGYKAQLENVLSACGNSSRPLEIYNDEIQSEINNFFLNYNYAALPNGVSVLLNLRHHPTGSEWHWTNGMRAEVTGFKTEDKNLNYGFLRVEHDNTTLELDDFRQQKSFICRINSPCSTIKGFDHLFLPSTSENCLLPCWLPNCSYTWHQSRNLCLKIGGDLAHFVDIPLEEELTKWLRKIQPLTQTVKQFWIGLYRDSWFWGSSGKEAKFTNWASNEPQMVSSSLRTFFSDLLYLPFFTGEYNRQWSTIRSLHHLHHMKFTFLCFRENNRSITRQVLETYVPQSADMSATAIPKQPISAQKAASMGLLIILVVIITCAVSTVFYGSLAGLYMFCKKSHTIYSRETTLSRSAIE